MDIADVEENLFAVSDAKLHGEMCKSLSAIYFKILSVFPSLEAARPRSRSGIQALCSLHIALEKTKNVLKHCSDSSKLYLAITGDSVLLKFEKAKCALIDSLKRVEDIVPQVIGCQILEIISELEYKEFSLDPLEKQIGDEIVALLQQGRKFSDSSDSNELESFHRAATKLGVTSSKAALTERRALKKLIERACMEEDKRKESIVAYLLHLMRKYSKLFRNDLADDNDSQGSAPCSPTVEGSFEDGGSGVNGHAFERQLTNLNSFNFKPNFRRSEQILVPPEELRCPISLQLMCDPVIIASGQTYERMCIEKWFNDGHETCPKTQQQLSHLCFTPNYCVKGLINSWCEQNGVPVPDGPPESLDLNYWRLALSQSESSNSRSMKSVGCCKLKKVKVVPLEESGTIDEVKVNEAENLSSQEEVSELDMFDRYQNFLTILNEGEDTGKKCGVAEQVRLLLKDDEEARTFLGSHGFVEALMAFLELAVHERNMMAQEIAAMALFNLAVNNDRNKEMMLAAGLIPLLEDMISSTNSHGSATALYLSLSSLEQAKCIIGSSKAVPFLVGILQSEADSLCKLDALHVLYNLSSQPSNISNLISAGIISGLQSLLALTGDHNWTEKCIAVLIYLASSKPGKEEMVYAPGLISSLAAILDAGEPIEQEQAASCLLVLCNESEKCSQMVLQEGVIPALVSISVNGTTRGREKAQQLLMLFREQRQQDQPPPDITLPQAESSSKSMPAPESNPLCKSTSRRKMGKALSFFWKSKSYSVSQY